MLLPKGLVDRSNNACFTSGKALSDKVANSVFVLFDEAFDVVGDLSCIMDNDKLLGAELRWLLQRFHVCKLGVDCLK